MFLFYIQGHIQFVIRAEVFRFSPNSGVYYTNEKYLFILWQWLLCCSTKYMHTHTHRQTNKHTYIHTHRRTQTYTDTHTNTQTHTHKHTQTYTDTHTHPHTNTHTHTQTQTHTHTYTNTHTQTHTHTFPWTCETVGQVFKFVRRLRWKINVVCMSLSPFVSFHSRLVTCLLTFPRNNQLIIYIKLCSQKMTK